MATAEAGDQVLLYVYDLSQGFAAQVSQTLLGKHIGGIWHTAVVVRGVEYFYGGGVQTALAGSTPYGHPVEIVELGETQIPQEVLDDYVGELRQVFTPEAYNLFTFNCNNFSNELSTFLTGQEIPEHIRALPAEVLSTPMGQMLAPMLTGVESQLGSVQQGDAPLDLSAIAGGVLVSGAADPVNASAETGSSRADPLVAAEASKPDEAPNGGHPDQHSKPAQTAEQASSGEACAAEGAWSAKEAFAAAVRAEFARIMAAGNVSANEAAVQAMAAARQALSQA